MRLQGHLLYLEPDSRLLLMINDINHSYWSVVPEELSIVADHLNSNQPFGDKSQLFEKVDFSKKLISRTVDFS